MRTAPLRAAIGTFAVASCVAVSSAGQTTATADALFKEGLKQMKAKRYDEGCPKIAESQKLEPRPGTLFTLAECWRKGERIATALALYEEYLREFDRMPADAKGKQRGRDKIAKKWREQIDKDVPRLTIMLPEDAPEGTVVKMDGAELGAPSLGIGLPVDPGERVLTTQAPGGELNEQRVTIAKKEGKSIELVVKPAPAEPEAEAEPVASPPPPAPDPTPAPDDAPQDDGGSSLPGNKTLGYIAGGVGLVGAVVGTIAGAVVFGKKGTINDHCGIGGDETACDREGKEAADSAQTFGLISTIGFGAAIVGFGAGTVLVLTASDPEADAAGVPMPRRGYVGLHGRF